MNETPKEPNAGNGDDAPTRRDGSPSQDDATPVEAQWDEIPDAAKDQDETVEDAVDDLPVMTAATEEEAVAAEAAESERATRAEAAAATAAAAVGAAAAVSGPAGQDRQPAAAAPPARGPGVLLLCWLGVLTLGVLFVLYLLVGDPAGLRDRLALAEAPEIQAAKAASEKATANAAAIAALEGKVAAPADAPAVTALRERVAGVEDELARLSTRLSETVAALEAARAEARAAPAAPGAGGAEAAAMAAQVSERVEALAADVSKRIDALASELSGRIDTLHESLSVADERIAALESRAEKASGRALATTMLALDDLRLGVVSGQPFEKLLERAQKAAPDATALREGAWVPFADKGLPTDDELLADMQAISVSIGQDRLKDTLSSGESWLDRAVGGVVERLKVRRVGADVAGDDPSAVAARAEAALVEGDTDKAIAEVEALEGDAAARFQDWLAGAKALVAAHSDIDAVEQAAIAAADGA